MKKLILVALILSAGLLADGYTTPLNAYKANNYQKACDGGYATDCSNLEASYDESVKQDYKKPKKLRQTAGNNSHDAEVARAATNLTTAVSDIAAYFTAKGVFESNAQRNFDKITNALTKDGKLKVKGGTIECASVILPTNAMKGNINKTTSYKVELVIKFPPNNDPVCQHLITLSGIKAMCGKSNNSEIIDECKIIIGGTQF